MLHISLVSNNIYFKFGLKVLIQKVMQENNKDFFCSSHSVNDDDSTPSHIVFRDFMIVINLKSKIGNHTNPDLSIYIPFSYQLHNIEELTNQIRKAIVIASMTRNDFLKENIYKDIGIKRHSQLSAAELAIVYLIGEGSDMNEISKILRRSERTVNTHCRNAMHKMAMKSRAELYRYASQLAHVRPEDEVMTICL